VILSLASSTAGANIYYTVDGTTPTASSQQYQAPFLVAANLTVKAIATASGSTASSVTSRSFALNIASETLVWSDEFTNSTGVNAQPNPAVWTYDTGNSGFGNHELEDYCAWGSAATPCSAANPNAYVGTDGYLHIVAQQTSPGVYTSARMKTQGLFSFQYGRIEFRAQVPEAQGFWPAAWLLGNNISTVNWPACGEMDVLERVNAAKTPDWNEGSVHGMGFTGNSGLGTIYNFPSGQTAAGWHTYGMVWSPGSVAYYVDNPLQPYVTYSNPGSLMGLAGAVWPFDAGQSSFIILNMAVGGDWPGSPNASTPFPSQILVDYVRVYTN
jgi:beta-glucanase (GH16 family)